MISSIIKMNVPHLRHKLIYPFILSLAIVGLLPNLAVAVSSSPQLHENVTVTGHLVTLGNLFKNPGLKGRTPLFRSPNPGTTGKVSVKRILRAAKKHGIRIAADPSFTMVTISRSSRVIELSELEDMIKGRLEEDYPDIESKSQLVITLPSELKKLHLDEALQGDLKLSSLNWSPRTGRFAARFALDGMEPIYIKGSASQMIKVVAAKTTIAKGAILRTKDVVLKLVKSKGRPLRAMISIGDLIGLSAKRTLTAGKLINPADLESPTLIKKNQLVTILLEVPGLIIRAEGKALADASKGQAVKVLNTQSKRIIHATAIASGLVSVSLAKSVASGS